MGAVLFEVQLRDLAMGSRKILIDLSETEREQVDSSASNFVSWFSGEGGSDFPLLDEEPGMHNDPP